MLEAGYGVALAGRTEDSLLETLGDAAGRGVAIATDVTDPTSVSALFAQVHAEFRRVDVLFNNAGIHGASVPIEDVAFDDWRAIVDTNLTGAFLCAPAAFRAMQNQRPRGGRIINNGSISAHRPRSNAIAYTATTP